MYISNIAKRRTDALISERQDWIVSRPAKWWPDCRMWVEESRTCRQWRPVLLGLLPEWCWSCGGTNLTQMTNGDLFGVRQDTVSRIWRRLLEFIEEVTCLHGIRLAEATVGELPW